VDWVESDYSAETAMRFARSGALVSIVAAEDACQVCQAMAGRVYIPSDAPRLPIRGCNHETCRCSFVAVDPETKQTVPDLVQWGARMIKQGRTDLARRILRRAVGLDERYEQGWLWLSAVVDDEEKIACLERVLALNPHNDRAAAGLESLRRGRGSGPAASTSPPRPSADSETASAIPDRVLDIRQERQVILGQWRQFVGFAVHTDAQTLLAQGHAFMDKLDDLGRQALSLLEPDRRPDELQLQWQELTEQIAALQEASQARPTRGESMTQERAVQDAIDSLLGQLDDGREALRQQISAAGGAAR
jgi:hypothetical protein